MVLWEAVGASIALAGFLGWVMVVLLKARRRALWLAKASAREQTEFAEAVKYIRKQADTILTRLLHLEKCIHRIDRESSQADADLRASMARIEEHQKTSEQQLRDHLRDSSKLSDRVRTVEVKVDTIYQKDHGS